MTHLIVYYVRTACFAISAITPNEHFQNKPEKVFIPRKVPGSVLIFNWTKKRIGSSFSGISIGKHQVCQHKTETKTERILCVCQSRLGGPGAE